MELGADRFNVKAAGFNAPLIPPIMSIVMARALVLVFSSTVGHARCAAGRAMETRRAACGGTGALVPTGTGAISRHS